mmetsp:Transcript_86011/g.229535  ORF Transcript_86011/g.229535 Transcript_86011/m.229535 type:complete len:137 (+) Transcript_86011:387-797(+)
MQLTPLGSQPPPPVEPPRLMETTAANDYTMPDLTVLEGTSVGARQMKTRDLAPVPSRDKTWLLEHNLAAKHICLATEEGIAAESALIEQGIPITVYSAHPDKFPMSNPSQGANPFSKNSSFTQPIEHYHKGPVKDL